MVIAAPGSEARGTWLTQSRLLNAFSFAQSSPDEDHQPDQEGWNPGDGHGPELVEELHALDFQIHIALDPLDIAFSFALEPLFLDPQAAVEDIFLLSSSCCAFTRKCGLIDFLPGVLLLLQILHDLSEVLQQRVRFPLPLPARHLVVLGLEIHALGEFVVAQFRPPVLRPPCSVV